MGYKISALSGDAFSYLQGLDDSSLAAHGARRIRVDANPGFPCRVTLEDAEIGETVFLLNYEHLSVDSPYRSAHAVFVREGARTCSPLVNEIPEQLRIRLLSIRAFDVNGMMFDADVVPGEEAEAAIKGMLENRRVDYLHIHNAKRGCYAARVDRV